jgi:hypothetical protein
VGTYELSATLPGFKRFVRPNIVIGVAQVIRVDITLEVGAAGGDRWPTARLGGASVRLR